MNHAVAVRLVLDMPAGIAPEADPRVKRPGAGLAHPRDDAVPRNESTLASMDFANAVAALHERTGIGIPGAGCSRPFALDRRVADARR